MRTTIVIAAVAGVLAVAAVVALVLSPPPAPPGMAYIPGGEFRIGTDDPAGWEDEKPAHRVRVRPVFIDVHEVTNDEFAAFVAATGYTTTAEVPPTLEDVLKQLPPGTPPPKPEQLVAGSMVFVPPAGPVTDTRDFTQWWRWTVGACWNHPEGPGSDVSTRGRHPVVQVSWDDATAYAKWAGKRLPTEAEWERAARGGLDGQPYAWGSERPTDAGPHRANLWQGPFPHANTAADGFAGTAPVGSFPPNGYGLHDTAGNVWEWCADWYGRALYRGRAGMLTVDPAGPPESRDAERPFTPLRVQKGGSFLCHDSYCSRYRPSARHGCSPDSALSHTGFRCAKSVD